MASHKHTIICTSLFVAIGFSSLFLLNQSLSPTPSLDEPTDEMQVLPVTGEVLGENSQLETVAQQYEFGESFDETLSPSGSDDMIPATADIRATESSKQKLAQRSGFWCEWYEHYEVPDDRLMGAILPHHDIATQMWEPLLSKLNAEPPAHIIILAPNHFAEEKRGILSVSADGASTTNQTTNMELITALLKQGITTEASNEVLVDHGWTIYLPTLRNRFPNASITPFLFSKSLSLIEVRNFVYALESILPENTFILLSADFSHDLFPIDAFERDKTTIKFIKSADYESIRALDSTYIDAPTALVAFLQLMDKMQTANHSYANSIKENRRPLLLSHHHAGQFSPSCNQPTTTYQVWGVFDQE